MARLSTFFVQVNQADSTVVCCRCDEGSTAGEESQIAQTRGQTIDDHRLLTRGDAPDPDHAVVTGRGHRHPVGRKGDGTGAERMTGQSPREPTGLQVPEPNWTLLTSGRGEHHPVGREAEQP